MTHSCMLVESHHNLDASMYPTGAAQLRTNPFKFETRILHTSILQVARPSALNHLVHCDDSGPKELKYTWAHTPAQTTLHVK